MMNVSFCLINKKLWVIPLKIANILITFLLLPTLTGFTEETPPSWEKIHTHLDREPVKHLLYNKFDRMLYFSAGNSLYRFDPEMKSEERLLSISGTDAVINDLHLTNEGALLVASENGTYVSKGGSAAWEKTFNASNPREACLSVASTEALWLIGTKTGLFIKNTGSHWKKIHAAPITNESIQGIKTKNEHVYISTGKNLYTLSPDYRSSETVFSSDEKYIIDEACDEDTLDEYPDCALQKTIKDFSLSDHDFVIATTRGIHFRTAADPAWETIPAITNIPLEKLTRVLLYSDNSQRQSILAATQEGLFAYDNKAWTLLYEGLGHVEVWDVVMTDSNELYIATNDGIYKRPFSPQQTVSYTAIDYEKAKALFIHEPAVGQAQRLAIEYADIHPEKIKAWQHAATKKAWLPTLSVDFDVDRNRTTSDNIWGSYTNGGQIVQGPDDKTSYRNSGWGASFSWDFSELVWNSDQTSIDSRAKLMIELREDILNQITRIYFERRRLQIELSASHGNDPSEDRLSKQMRVEELTALLDAMTGGKFSANIKDTTDD